MKHRHREIAARSGLSLATVDRVLHQRGGVRDSTVRQVRKAIAALDQQQDQSPRPSRVFRIDLVVSDPSRIEAALRAELPGLFPAVIHPTLHPAADPLGVLRGLDRSDGLILEASESPDLLDALAGLEIPVVTLGPDLPTSKRVAHVGLDETEAGATAAYLLDQFLADRAGDVLMIAPVAAEARTAGFRAELRTRAPNRRLLPLDLAVPREDLAVPREDLGGPRADPPGPRTELRGVRPNPLGPRADLREPRDDLAQVRAVLAGNPSVRAVYTAAGGSARAVVEAFAAEHRNYDVFVAHDLDDENARLLRAGRLSAVLHHDPRADLRAACLAILQTLGARPGPVRSAPAAVRVLTPVNLPPF